MIPYEKGMTLATIVGSMLVVHRKAVAKMLGVDEDQLPRLLSRLEKEPDSLAEWAAQQLKWLADTESLRKEFSEIFLPLVGEPVPHSYKNELGYTLVRIHNEQELLARFMNIEQRAKLQDRMNRPGVTAVVIYENLQMDSPMHGLISAILVGPEFTYKTIAEAAAGHFSTTLRSSIQYPVAFYEKES